MKTNIKRITTVWLLAAMISLLFLSTSCKTVSKKDESHFLANLPAQSLGVLHLNIVKRHSDTLLPRDVSFIFDPPSDTIKFHHKMMGDNIWIYLTKDERTLLRQGIEQYLKAFADKTLTLQGAKEKGAFGKTTVFMTWGLSGSAHSASPTLRFDYQFITPQRPYFILATAMTQGKDGANSPAIRIAVSPAQCKDLLKVLDEQDIAQLINELKTEYEKFDVVDSNSTTVTDIESAPEGSNDPVKAEDISFDEF